MGLLHVNYLVLNKYQVIIQTGDHKKVKIKKCCIFEENVSRNLVYLKLSLFTIHNLPAILNMFLFISTVNFD